MRQRRRSTVEAPWYSKNASNCGAPTLGGSALPGSTRLSVEPKRSSPTDGDGDCTPTKARPEARRWPSTQTSRVQTPSGIPAGFGEESRSETTANGPDVHW